MLAISLTATALLVHRGLLLPLPLPPSAARLGGSPMASDALSGVGDSPYLALAQFNTGTWRGRCTRVSPSTAEPLGGEVVYVQEVKSEFRQPFEQLVLRSSTRIDGSDAAASDLLMPSSTTDVDLDGTYSADHAEGLELAALLASAEQGAEDSRPPAFVIEHSIAASDDARQRCLLVYRAAAGEAAELQEDAQLLQLEEAMLLSEARQPEGGSGDEWVEPSPAAWCTISQLLGSWTGDASVRRQQPAAPSNQKRRPAGRGGARGGGGGGAPKGFGSPAAAGKEAAEKSLRRALFGDAAEAGAVSTNVYKAKLSYSELYGTVVRTLGVTAFGGDDLEPISSMGKLTTTQGVYMDYEAVSFDATDPSRPRMLLLPAGGYVLAPSRVAPGRPFTTEFGVVLPPGESFGWKGFVTGDGEASDEERTEAAAKAGAGLSDSDTARLVRVQRLYDGKRFVSGTTSLCSADN